MKSDMTANLSFTRETLLTWFYQMNDNLFSFQLPRVPMQGLSNVVPPQDPDQIPASSGVTTTATSVQTNLIQQQVPANITTGRWLNGFVLLHSESYLGMFNAVQGR